MLGFIWKLVRRLLLATGVLAAVLIAISLLWGRGGTDTAWIGNEKGCDFGFEVPKRRWVQDDITGSHGLIRANIRPVIYLFGQRTFQGKTPGEWFLTTDFQCLVEPQKVLRGRDGREIPTWMAYGCKPTPGAWPQFTQSFYLYAMVPAGDDADVIYMSGRSRDELEDAQDEFRKIAASYRTPDATCPWKKKS